MGCAGTMNGEERGTGLHLGTLGREFTGDAFDRALGKIAKAPAPKSVQKRKKKKKRFA
jgi:hypothetical protein